jgi:hypothetical protein
MITRKFTAKEDRLLKLALSCAIGWQDGLADANRGDKRQYKIERRLATAFRKLLAKHWRALSFEDAFHEKHKNDPTVGLYEWAIGARKRK